MMELMPTSLDFSLGMIPFRWCFTTDQEKEIFKEHEPWIKIFLVVESEGYIRERILVPVSRTTQYIGFNKPGKQNLHAFMIKPNEHSVDAAYEMEKELMKKDNPFDIFSYRTDLRSFEVWPCEVLSHTVVEFDVPDSYFANNAPLWLQEWATMVISSPLKDQCDLIGRLIFAFTVQPILVLGVFALLSTIGIAATTWFILILGLRDIPLKHLFFLDGGDPERAWKYSESFRPTISATGERYESYRRSSFYLENSRGEKYPPMVWVFHPISLLAIAGVAAWWNFGDYTYLQRVLFLAMYVFLIILGLWLMPKLVTQIFGPAMGYLLAPQLEQVQSSWQEKRAMAKQQKIQDTLEMLSCQPNAPQIAVPKKTFSLWYQETKARHCKRFANW